PRDSDSNVEVLPAARAMRPSSSPSRIDTEMFQALERVQKQVFPGAITLPSMLTGATDMAQLRARGVQAYGFGPIVDDNDGGLGGIYGPRVEVASAASDEDGVRNGLKAFTKAYELVEENFADPVNPDKAIYKGAVPGMLRTLDPHSNFFDPHDFQLLREDQKGHYYGVGMTVAERNHRTIVIAPFTGSPAYKAGIRPGDVIMTVNDKSTENLTTTEVADLLKGPRGTQVQIVISREGADKPLTFNVIRDEISRKSVQDAIWLKPGIAYMN